MKKKPTKLRTGVARVRAGSTKRAQGLSDKKVAKEGCGCSVPNLTNLTEEEQKAMDKMIESLAGPTEEEFKRKFEELVKTAGEAANAGRDEEAQKAAFSLLMMAGARAIKNPGPETELENAVSACEDKGDWAGAEKGRRKLLAFYQKEGCAVTIPKEQYDLSRLLRFLNRLDEAWRYARAATRSARKADLDALILMMLENEAQCALERKDVGRALLAAEEAMKLVKPERIQNLIRTRVLTIRAQCLLETGNEAGAERDLKVASKLESDLTFGGMSGAINARARRQEVQAELQVRRKKLAGAAKSLKRAMELRREGADGCCGQSPYALVARVRGLERFAEVSRQLGHVAAQKKALSEAKSLREQGHLP